jgi:hypothetical protein
MASSLTKREVALRARRSNPPRFVDIEDLEEPMNILCHGDTGAGKNRLWGHLPRLVIIACETGSVSIKKAGIRGVKVIPCHSWPDIVGAYEWLRDNPDEYDWCMFDSITKAQSMCIRTSRRRAITSSGSCPSSRWWRTSMNSPSTWCG